jgi:hypothetical protein
MAAGGRLLPIPEGLGAAHMAANGRVVLDMQVMNRRHFVAPIRGKISSTPGDFLAAVALAPGRAVVSGTTFDKTALRLAVDDSGFNASVKD